MTNYYYYITVDTLKESAIKTLNSDEVFVGQVFIVKDFFKGVFWNRIPIDTRKLLGKRFLEYIEKTNFENVEKLNKTGPGQQQYKKIA